MLGRGGARGLGLQADLAAIFGKLSRNMGGALPADFVSWLEVLLGGESDLLMCDPASPYSYGADFATKLAAQGLSDPDVTKVKIWNSGSVYAGCAAAERPCSDCLAAAAWARLTRRWPWVGAAC